MTPNRQASLATAQSALALTGVLLAGLAVVVTAWHFAGPLGAVMPFQGWQPVATDAALFTVFAAHHSLLARPRAKQALGALLPPGWHRALYFWLASLLLWLTMWAWRPIGGLFYDAGRTGWVVLLPQAAGLGLAVASLRRIRLLEFAGLRSPATQVGRAEPLVLDGPYRWVRHPLYLGILLLLATPRLTGDRLVFTALVFTYLVVGARWEERDLERTFGADYQRYAARVRWRLLPFVY